VKTLTNEKIISLTPEQIVTFTPEQIRVLEYRLKRNIAKQGYILKKTKYKYRIGSEHVFMLLDKRGRIQTTGDLFDVIVWAFGNNETC